MALNTKKMKIWEKQKQLLDDKVEIISGMESEYDKLEKQYLTTLKEVIELSNYFEKLNQLQ